MPNIEKLGKILNIAISKVRVNYYYSKSPKIIEGILVHDFNLKDVVVGDLISITSYDSTILAGDVFEIESYPHAYCIKASLDNAQYIQIDLLKRVEIVRRESFTVTQSFITSPVKIIPLS